MSDENEKPDEQPLDEPDIEEVVTDFNGGLRVRSGFEIEEVEPGVLSINIFGPIFEFDGDDHDDLEDEGDG